MVRVKIARTTVIDAVVEQMERAILVGEYTPGSRLPSESVLAAQFEVSRPLVREALGRLRERGYVHTVNGRGTYVRESNLEAVSETLQRQVRIHVGTRVPLDDLYEARRTIEVSSARLAAARADGDGLDRLGHFIETMRESMPAHAEAYTAADTSFHLAIAQASRNPLFPLLLAPVVDLIVKAIFQSVRSSPEHMENGVNDHEAILRLLRDRDSEGAARAIEEHLQHSRAMHSTSVVETAAAGTDIAGWPRAVELH